MPHPPPGPLPDLLQVARRLSDEAMAGRPSDQPDRATARLERIDYQLDPVGGVEIENLAELSTGGCCRACLTPLGARTRRRMKVRYGDGLSRRCDGVLAQLSARPAGPTYRLWTGRFLNLLTPGERRVIRRRAVTVVNPTKTTPDLFEIVGSSLRVDYVALRGGNPDRQACETCGRLGPPVYSLAGCLPDWLNPGGDHQRRGQPDRYVSTDSLPNPPPAWFAVGDWPWGISLAVTRARWSTVGRRAGRGVHAWPLGVVPPELAERAADPSGDAGT